jgi:hypothetical protein
MTRRPREFRSRAGPHVSLWRFGVEVLLLGAAWWLMSSEWGPLVRSESPAKIVGGAIWRLLLAWFAATAITLWTYLVTSRDDFGDLLAAAFKSAVYAVWFVPAILLVAPPASALAQIAGILLSANAARLVVANPAPRRRSRLRRAWKLPHRLFGSSRMPLGPISRESTPAMVGTLALQATALLLWIGQAQAAVVLVALGVGGLTWTSVARGAYRLGKRSHRFHLAVNVLGCLLVSVSLSVVRLQFASPGTPGSGDTDGLLAATREEVQRLVGLEPVLPAPVPKPKPIVTKVVAPEVDLDKLGKGGMPGLILRPKAGTEAQSVTIPPTYRLHISLSPSKPISIPFTGEYRLFRVSSGELPPGSFERSGAPIDSIYVTTNGGPMQTEAYQPFDPPVEFSTCAKVLITLQSGEMFPASASLLLVADAGTQEVGPEIFGLSAADEETLSFTVPPAPNGFLVKALRVIFRRNPMEASHSTQVALERFTFIPRGL